MPETDERTPGTTAEATAAVAGGEARVTETATEDPTAKLSRLEAERALWQKDLEEKEALKQQVAAARAEVQRLQGQPAPSATDRGTEPADILGEMYQRAVVLARQGDRDAQVYVAQQELLAETRLEVALVEYPPEDRRYLRQIVVTGRAGSVEDAALLLEGAKARLAARTKSQSDAQLAQREAAIKAQEEAHSRSVVGVASRPVGAAEAAGGLTMTYEDFARRMDSLSPTSKEAIELNKRTEPGGDIRLISG